MVSPHPALAMHPPMSQRDAQGPEGRAQGGDPHGTPGWVGTRVRRHPSSGFCIPLPTRTRVSRAQPGVAPAPRHRRAPRTHRSPGSRRAGMEGSAACGCSLPAWTSLGDRGDHGPDTCQERSHLCPDAAQGQRAHGGAQMRYGPVWRWSVPRRDWLREGRGTNSAQGHRAGTGLSLAEIGLQKVAPACMDVAAGTAGLNQAAEGTVGIQHQHGPHPWSPSGASPGSGLGLEGARGCPRSRGSRLWSGSWDRAGQGARKEMRWGLGWSWNGARMGLGWSQDRAGMEAGIERGWGWDRTAMGARIELGCGQDGARDEAGIDPGWGSG